MSTCLVCEKSLREQQGVYTIMTALVIVVLMGFVGLAIDSSRQQAVIVELQNAADACVLAAAVEMNGQTDATSRATLAGRYVGGVRNLKHFQSESTDIASTDVTFSDNIDGPFNPSASVSGNVRFVRCTARKGSFVNNFMAVLGLNFSDLSATATASVQGSRSTCAVPLAVCGNPIQTSFGLSTTSALHSKPIQGAVGDLYVADFSSCTNAVSAVEVLMRRNGACNISTGADRCIVRREVLGDSFRQAWNTRFGVVHADEVNRQDWTADVTGFSYPAPNRSDPSQITDNPFIDYRSNKAPSRVPFQSKIPGATTIQQTDLINNGSSNRRLVVFPVTNCSNLNNRNVIGWACGLMLNPVGGINPGYQTYRIQLIGVFKDFDGSSPKEALPCVTSGIPGGDGALGPSVPTLFQ